MQGSVYSEEEAQKVSSMAWTMRLAEYVSENPADRSRTRNFESNLGQLPVVFKYCKTFLSESPIVLRMIMQASGRSKNGVLAVTEQVIPNSLYPSVNP